MKKMLSLLAAAAAAVCIALPAHAQAQHKVYVQRIALHAQLLPAQIDLIVILVVREHGRPAVEGDAADAIISPLVQPLESPRQYTQKRIGAEIVDIIKAM